MRGRSRRVCFQGLQGCSLAMLRNRLSAQPCTLPTHSCQSSGQGAPLKPLCFSALLGYTSSSSPIFPFVPGNGDHFSQDWEFLCRLQQWSQGYTEVSPRHVRGPEGFWMECVKISTCKQNRMCGETSTITNCRFRPAHVYLRTSHARGVCCDCDCVGDVTDSQSEDENTTDKDLASSVT